MGKSESAYQFYNYLNKLKENEQDNFSRIANKLLSVNYICDKKESEKDDYLFIKRNYELFEDFFDLIQYDLEMSKADQVIYLYHREGTNRLNLKLNESMILLLLRKLYFLKMQSVSINDNVSLSLIELHDAIDVLGIFNNRMKKTDLESILRLFKRYNIIDFYGKINNDDSQIIIYPTINYVLNIKTIQEIEERILYYIDEGGTENEEINESEID